MTNIRKLTDRQGRFVREYLVDLNATRAAVRAGYSRAGAGTRGWTLRQIPAVAAAIDAAMAERARLVGITAERVLFEVALLGFANIMDNFETRDGGAACVDLSRLTRNQAAAITAVQVDEGGAAGRGPRKVKIKLADKSCNFELISRHLGMFPRQPAREKEKGEGAKGGKVKLSDIELTQKVGSILARGRKDGAGAGGT